MIQCPKCNATLPEGSARCQFCGATFTPTKPVRKSADDDRYEPTISERPGWVIPLYYIIASWYVISGLSGIVLGLIGSKDGANILGIAFGAFVALVGLGLLLKVPLVRNIVNILCWVNILFGVLGFIGAFLGSFIFGILSAILMIRAVIDVALNLVMIFVIGETDSAPNF